MGYKALYRTWRPGRFGDVVGQDHIVKVLSGQIASGRIAHAYLFAGPRGTGKTSLAKIFARAVNCTEKNGAEPCGTCSACTQTFTDNSVDIVEIDAASNNGVDSVRELRDRVNLLPAFLARKVYIIDEVHMLSKGAFNALLKTLEEPPAHVIFILATTEPHRLPATILSRCQRFDFRRIPVGTISERLIKVAQAEGYTYDENALNMIARAAQGGMRDALSILDQCASFGDISVQNVSASLGGGDMQMLFALIERITEYDEKGALEQLRDIIDAGADTRTLIHDLADAFRQMMWLAAGADIDEADERLRPLAKAFGKNACIRALGLLIQKEYEIRQNLRADIVLETAVVAIMCPEDDAAATDKQRIEKLEARLAALEKRPAAILQAPAAPVKPPVKPPKQEKQPAGVQQKAPAGGSDMHEIWEALLQALEDEAYFVFTHAQKATEVFRIGDLLEVKFDGADEISADYLKQPAAQKAIAKTLEAIAGKPLAVSILVHHDENQTPADADILKKFGADIEEI